MVSVSIARICSICACLREQVHVWMIILLLSFIYNLWDTEHCCWYLFVLLLVRSVFYTKSC